ncbi:MAG TPA: hypothetical protein VFA09_16565 [Ktedonobacteraceae bacterium]|jgi:pimeloyl-ACP methyl ester carboxylesterase|nr:hypothetical protein [Ktedonobacteraceae bacterium]
MTSSFQPEVGTVPVNGTKLYYEALGEGHPLVLIHGGFMDRRMWDDPRLFKDADKLEKDIAGARRVTIPRTHHMPNMEKPVEFNAIVLDFLARL